MSFQRFLHSELFCLCCLSSYCEVAFKPVATIMQKQNTIDIHGDEIDIKAKGRHDACVVPRAVPIVESMLALTLVDAYLRSLTNKF